MRTPRQIYLEAARLVAEGKFLYSCHAVQSANDNTEGIWEICSHDPFVVKYSKVFSPTGSYHGFAESLEEIHDDAEEQNVRVLMTSLMAVCWRDFE